MYCKLKKEAYLVGVGVASQLVPPLLKDGFPPLKDLLLQLAAALNSGKLFRQQDKVVPAEDAVVVFI